MNEFVLGSIGLMVCSLQAKFHEPDKYCFGVSMMVEHVLGLVGRSLSKLIWTNCMQVMQEVVHRCLVGQPTRLLSPEIYEIGQRCIMLCQ
jgi:hypothetical protein